MKRLITIALLAIVALSIASHRARAQAPLQNAMFTAGTSATDNQGDDWAFLLFQLTSDLESLLGRRLAIYQKPGNLDAPGAFVHSGNVALQDNPLIIKALLNRAAALGQAPDQLNLAIDQLFGELIPDPALPVEAKLSAVIRGSIGDPRQFSNLMLLARMHPGVSLALGLAHAQRINPGTTTFEIRETNLAGDELGVVGRVEVTAGAPVILSAPHAPVNVPEISPMGHLNARLRWGMPDDLRRLALLQYGYNLYAVDKAYAESIDWHNLPPAPGLLAAAAADLPQVRLINQAPILPVALFDEIQALDLAADPTTFFIADDGGLASATPQPYRDGDRVYYFVTARDVLGRDGFSSNGTEVVLHDRVPPNAPSRPTITNVIDYNNNQEDHRLQVRWRQVEPTPDEPIAGYYIYRWQNVTDVQKFAADPLQNRITELIPHVPGQSLLDYIDDQDLDSPAAPNDHDKTFWYTVRALKTTNDGGVLSPNSAPAFGVLRNRFAPAAPIGAIFITCCKPDVAPDRVEDVPDASADDPLRAIFEAVCIRKSRTVAWAEFALNDERDPAAFVGRYHFQFFRNKVRARLDLGRALYDDGPVKIFCRVGDDHGYVSAWTELEQRNVPQVGFIRQFIFEADEQCETVELDEVAIAAGCSSHSPGGLNIPDLPLVPADGDQPIKPIIVHLGLTDNAREYRIYRRIDEGEMTLWRQGLSDQAEAETIVEQDGSLPPNAGEIAYFGQFLDDNGNASELKLLGKHVALAQPAPKPMLSPPAIDGNDTDPRMKIRWFSPPHGVERFAVLIGSDPGPLPPSISPNLSPNQEAPLAKTEFSDGNIIPKNVTFGSYFTPSLEAGFGPGPDYEISIPVKKGRTYQVQIKAIAKAGGPPALSVPYEFKWPTEDIDEATGPNVPWPARPLPAVADSVIDPDLAPIRIIQSDFNGVGIVIGHVPPARLHQNFSDLNTYGHFIDPGDDPRSYLFPKEVGDSLNLLPMAVYRYQSPSPAFPETSRDLIQVTPLMNSIATGTTATARLIRDPFIKLIPSDPSASDPNDPWLMTLLDTQPVVRTASYVYLIVRFNPDGEIASVHPLAPFLVE